MKVEIGVDITSVRRISAVIEKFGISFMNRFLLPNEILIACRNKHMFSRVESSDIGELNNIISTHMPTNRIRYYFKKDDVKLYVKYNKLNILSLEQSFDMINFNMQTIASFWAVKEACSKALGVGIGKSLSFHDMCIFKDIKGKPHLALKKKKFKYFKIDKISIGVSHDNDMAIATCLITMKD